VSGAGAKHYVTSHGQDMESFTYEQQAQRIVFGFGRLAGLSEELRRLGTARAMVVSTPGHAAAAASVAQQLAEQSAGVFGKAAMHTPIEVSEAAVAEIRRLNADAVVSLGGGSATGLGKAIARRTGLKHIAVPTTYAGSEATAILGETQGGRKTTLHDPGVLPNVVLYDAELTMTLPPALSVASGLNAVAHAVEARYAHERNPMTSVSALEGIRAMAGALPRIVADPREREARGDALYAAWACGMCLGQVGMALHHKICHVLGGTFDLPHAQTHAIVLPHAVAYNETAAAEELAEVAAIFGSASVSGGIFDFARRLGAPLALRDIGMPENGLSRAAEEIAGSPYWNPRPVEREAIERLLRRAFAGDRPRVD
jgi:maleylacetate reductase